MRSNKKGLIFLVLLIFIFAINGASASDLENTTLDAVLDESLETNLDNISNNLISGQSEVITVDDWDNLQYYCSQSEKNYVLKLKENINFYPTDPTDESY